MKILLVHSNTLYLYLRGEAINAYARCMVESTSSFDDAITMQDVCDYKLVILDTEAGLDAFSTFRRRFPQTGLIAFSPEKDMRKSDSFLRYADDFVHEQIDNRELAERIFAIVRRRNGSAGPEIDFRDFRLNQGRRAILYGETPLELHPRAFDVGEVFILNPFRILRHEELLNRAMRIGTDVSAKYMDVIVLWLRSAMVAAAGYHHIGTAWGRGYYLTSKKLKMKHKRIGGRDGQAAAVPY